jgi:hypothetical protein
MAITATVLTPDTFGFAVNGFTADASACEELQAAPGAGKYIHLTHVTINSGASLSITLGSGEVGGNVETAILGPITYATGTTIQWTFCPPIKLTENKSLTVDSSGAGAVLVFAQGHIT